MLQFLGCSEKNFLNGKVDEFHDRKKAKVKVIQNQTLMVPVLFLELSREGS